MGRNKSKGMNGKDIEKILYRALVRGRVSQFQLCSEVPMPSAKGYTAHQERVDLLGYSKGEWRFYEIKSSLGDFHSPHKWTFLGHYNYFAMPVELYEKVKHEIPDGIGCYVIDNGECRCIKNAKRQDLRVSEDLLKNAFIQSLSRECFLYRCGYKEDWKHE
jgi:hypothetical protein